MDLTEAGSLNVIEQVEFLVDVSEADIGTVCGELPLRFINTLVATPDPSALKDRLVTTMNRSQGLAPTTPARWPVETRKEASPDSSGLPSNELAHRAGPHDDPVFDAETTRPDRTVRVSH